MPIHKVKLKAREEIAAGGRSLPERLDNPHEENPYYTFVGTMTGMENQTGSGTRKQGT